MGAPNKKVVVPFGDKQTSTRHTPYMSILRHAYIRRPVQARHAMPCHMGLPATIPIRSIHGVIYLGGGRLATVNLSMLNRIPASALSFGGYPALRYLSRQTTQARLRSMATTTVKAPLSHEERTAQEPRDADPVDVVLSEIIPVNTTIRVLRLTSTRPKTPLQVNIARPCAFSIQLFH